MPFNERNAKNQGADRGVLRIPTVRLGSVAATGQQHACTPSTREFPMATNRRVRQAPWNKGKIVDQKAPLKLRETWANRVRLQLGSNLRDLALFNLAIDSKLRACDHLGLRICDIAHESHVNSRTVVMQQKTRRPVQLEITEMSRDDLQEWTRTAGLRGSDFLFPSRSGHSPHLSTRQYARIVHRWVRQVGLDSSCWHTHDATNTSSADLSANQEP